MPTTYVNQMSSIAQGLFATTASTPNMAAAGAGGNVIAPAPLDGHGIFAIIVFAVVSLIVILPVQIPISRRLTRKLLPTTSDETRRTVTVDHVVAPLIGVLLLLATTTIGGEQVKAGIVGEDHIEPYDVLALFISLAYIAISLDATGLLRYLAFWVCIKAGKNGYVLYALLYVFFWTLGVAVGNDPVILSGTSFLVYFTRVAGISPPSAWIWAQFVAANVSSAVLVSSNPTNLVIAKGFNISFITYTAYMVLPSLASAVASIITLLFFFRNRPAPSPKSSKDEATATATGIGKQGDKGVLRRTRPSKAPGAGTEPADEPAQEPVQHEQEDSEEHKLQPTVYIPQSIIPPDVDPRSALVDPFGAIFGSIVMAVTLIVLIATSVVGGVKVFMIALPGAVLCLLRDAIYDYLRWRAEQKVRERQAEPECSAPNANGIELQDLPPAHLKEPSASDLALPTGTASMPSSPDPALGPPPARTTLLVRLRSGIHKLGEMFPTVAVVMSRLPFPLLPFAFSMFILVQGLAHVGFIDIMARGLGRVCGQGGVAGTAFFISLLGIILCNIGGTNIGATILLTKSLQSAQFTSQLPAGSEALITKSALYSVAFGSNVGALGGTFAASLAGLLWRQGLRQGGLHIRARDFLLWCAVTIVPATASGIAVLLAEIIYFHVGE